MYYVHRNAVAQGEGLICSQDTYDSVRKGIRVSASMYGVCESYAECARRYTECARAIRSVCVFMELSSFRPGVVYVILVESLVKSLAGENFAEG